MFVNSSCFFLFNASVLFYLKFCGTNKRPFSKTVEPRPRTDSEEIGRCKEVTTSGGLTVCAP